MCGEAEEAVDCCTAEFSSTKSATADFEWSDRSDSSLALSAVTGDCSMEGGGGVSKRIAV